MSYDPSEHSCLVCSREDCTCPEEVEQLRARCANLRLGYRGLQAELTEAKGKLAVAEVRGADLERAHDRERTGRLQAEERVAELEGLLEQFEFCYAGECAWCNEHEELWRDDMGWQHIPGCPWGQAADNHRASAGGES